MLFNNNNKLLLLYFLQYNNKKYLSSFLHGRLNPLAFMIIYLLC